MSSMYDEMRRDLEYARFARKRILELCSEVDDLKARLSVMERVANDADRFLLELSAAFTVSVQAVTASGIMNKVRRMREMRREVVSREA